MTLEPFDHLAFGDVYRPVERHVFEEMRDALLRVGFVERTRGDTHADRRVPARGLVLHNRVTQTVGERAVNNPCISIEVACFLDEGGLALRYGRSRRGDGGHQHTG